MLGESSRSALQSQVVRVDLLKSNLSAFADRLASIHRAKESLEIMSYIWREDTSGVILLHEILNAADRGVRVRVILDALNFTGANSLFIGLNQHPNIEVRLYNPFKFGFLNKLFKFFEFLLRATFLNRRLHNKCWIADREMAICGGRNIGDEYFGNKQTANFTDLDISLTGSPAKNFGECFDIYWQNRQVKKIDRIRGLYTQCSFEEFREQITALRAIADSTTFGAMLSERRIPTEAEDNFMIPEKDILVVWDPPQKIRAPQETRQTTADAVFNLVTSARKNVWLISPYFVPGPRGSAALKVAAQNNCKVTILTNSLAATDAIAAHSGVVKYRKSLLDHDIRLFELKPAGKMHKRLGILPKSRASLHAKAIVVDEGKSYIGSFNLDPRSALLNCEMGVVTAHKALAQEVLRIYQDAIDPTNSWQLIFTSNRRLTWTGSTELGEKETYYKEPQASVTKRLAAWIFSCLPIEPLL